MGLHLPMWEVWVTSLDWELDLTCLAAKEPRHRVEAIHFGYIRNSKKTSKMIRIKESLKKKKRQTK